MDPFEQMRRIMEESLEEDRRREEEEFASIFFFLSLCVQFVFCSFLIISVLFINNQILLHLLSIFFFFKNISHLQISVQPKYFFFQIISRGGSS